MKLGGQDRLLEIKHELDARQVPYYLNYLSSPIAQFFQNRYLIMIPIENPTRELNQTFKITEKGPEI